VTFSRPAPSSSERKNLVMVRAGRASQHMSYCRDRERENFDVGISWYDEGTAADFGMADGALFVHDGWGATALEGNVLMQAECRELFERYDYVCFMDDDMVGDAAGVSRMFDSCRRLGLDIAQPAIVAREDSFNNHPITAVHTGFSVRFTNHVEPNAVVMSARVLQRLVSLQVGAASAYGVEAAWRHMVKLGTMAIIDDAAMIHSRPAGRLGFAPEGADAARRNMISYSITGSPLYLTYGGFTTDGGFVAMGRGEPHGSRKVLELLERAAPEILASLHQLDPEVARVRVGKYLSGNRDFVASDPGHKHVGSILRDHLAATGINV
jgi:hypothetical protein